MPGPGGCDVGSVRSDTAPGRARTDPKPGKDRDRMSDRPGLPASFDTDRAREPEPSYGAMTYVEVSESEISEALETLGLTLPGQTYLQTAERIVYELSGHQAGILPPGATP